jgi:glucokinase
MAAADRDARAAAIGIDVGGTKIAAAVVDTSTGMLLDRRRIPTLPQRGGPAVLADCAALAAELAGGRLPVGIALCELVDLEGRPASGDTVDWRGLDVAGEIGAPAVFVESDVRAAALAEARLGAAVGVTPFLHVVVGTGASACLVIEGRPYVGARGEALVLGAPPVEGVASGPALARAGRLERAEDVLADPSHVAVVDDAAAELGSVLAVLANALDPALVVLGGGLGTAPAFRARVERALQERVAYPRMPPLEVVGSSLGTDGGVVGAALLAADARR